MAFSFFRTVTVDHTKVPSSQSNFPVLVSGTYSYLATVANGGLAQNGNDVGFYADLGLTTKLDWEIESYNAATGTVVYWVRLSSVSSSVDTVFYMAYGDASITTDQSNKTGVWDANYKSVYHLPDGTTLSGGDSTSNSNSLTNSFGAATTGKIGGAFLGTGNIGALSAFMSRTSNGFTLGGSGSLTLEAWVFNTAWSSETGMVLEATPVNAAWELFFNAGNLILRGGSSSGVNYAYSLTNSTWYHIVAVISGTTGTIFINGSQVATGSVAAIATTARNLYLAGYEPGTDRCFNGKIDEARVSNIARAADWITAEYNNQNSPSTFYTVGSQVANGSSDFPPNPNLLVPRAMAPLLVQ